MKRKNANRKRTIHKPEKPQTNKQTISKNERITNKQTLKPIRAYRRFGLDEQTKVSVQSQPAADTASQPPPICDMAPNNQDGKNHHFTGAPLSRTQELTPRPLTPRAQELLDSDLRRENERRQEDSNRWQEEAEQQNQLVLNHQQAQQVPGQVDEVEIVEVVNAAPVNNGDGEVRNWIWKCTKHWG